MPRKSSGNISLIGAGSVGSALALALYEKGYRIGSIINRSGPPAVALARKVSCKRVSTSVGDVDRSSDILLIAVPDTALASVAAELSGIKRLKWSNRFIAHTSGAFTSDVFSTLRRKGALAASLHPVQTFPRKRSRVKLRGIFFGIEGSPDALQKAEHLVHDLEAHAVTIAKELKPLYHIACVFASSYLVSILNCVAELSHELHLKASWTEVFGPLMTSATENTITSSPADALTGPVLRGDLTTLSLHLTTLASYAPQFLPLYSVAAIDVARTAATHGRLGSEEYKNIVTLFKTFIRSYPVTTTKKQ